MKRVREVNTEAVRPAPRATTKLDLPESGTVTVACKLPNGLILRVFREVQNKELVLGGGIRDVTQHEAYGPTVKLHGAAVPFGVIPDYRIIGGYALTEDVDAEFFAKWWAQNQEAEVVKNGLVFAYEGARDVGAKAKEQRKLTSGMEPMNPAGDPRRPKSPNPNLKDITPSDLVKSEATV